MSGFFIWKRMWVYFQKRHRQHWRDAAAVAWLQMTMTSLMDDAVCVMIPILTATGRAHAVTSRHLTSVRDDGFD